MADHQRSNCVCRDVPSTPIKTDHEDDLIVHDVVMRVPHRCKLCGRKFDVQYVPGDYLLGDHRASEGYRGKPLLSANPDDAPIDEITVEHFGV